MTRDDDFLGQIEGYLNEYQGNTPLPDAVRDAIRAELPSTRQIGPVSRSNRSGLKRPFPMSKNVRIGLAAAAVVLVAIVGINLIPRTNVGPSVTTSPTPFASLPANSASIPPRSASTWTATANLLAARANHTATLLPDGKVLVAGGYKSDGALDSAELYDPASGSWSATGRMTTARVSHSATLLSDGKVLVVGGGGPSETLRSAELYDPSTGSWTATGSMSEERRYHTATLLPDGSVLVAGGTPGIGAVALSSAEVYDPQTGTWTSVSPMTEARYDHTATLLPDRKVLVAGGSGGANGIDGMNSAELFNPADGSWTATGALIGGRADHTATLLADGVVLVAGGYGRTSLDRGALGSAELYDPATASFTATGNLIESDAYETATLLPDGRVLVAGGAVNGPGVPRQAAEVYDPATRQWSAAGTMMTARSGATATLLPDRTVLVVGGVVVGDPIATAELYRPGG